MKKTVALIIIVVCLALGLAAGLMFNRSSSKTIVVTTDFGIKDIGELATAEYFYTAAETYKGQPISVANYDIPFTTSSFVYTVDGYIKAGFDFEEIEVERDDANKKVIVILPLARILDSKADPNTVEIFDVKNSILNPIQPSESFISLSEIEDKQEEKAIESELLIRAKENAMDMIENMLKTQLDPEYTIEFKENFKSRVFGI